MRRVAHGGTTHPMLNRPGGRFGTTIGAPRPSLSGDIAARAAAQRIRSDFGSMLHSLTA